MTEEQSVYDHQRERESIGVRNVVRRIYLVYGDPYRLEIERLPQGTLMRLILPCEQMMSFKGGTVHEPHLISGG
ncbi:hypothetical protein D3C84_932510 [compost metagenome]